MQPELKKFNELKSELKKDENYVPRDYKSIGGMWSVDTWQKDNLKIQVMDEGYTVVLMNINENGEKVWSITDTYKKPLQFDGITEEEFIAWESNKLNKKMKIK